MNCDIVKDLIPLYIDGCCSKESEKAVEEHMRDCDDCKKLWEDMQSTADMITVPDAPGAFRKLDEWKASVLQSLFLFFSFALITVGVALEAGTPSGLTNSFWALNLVVPSTGFMLSLANWYFVSVYRDRRRFSNYSLLATLAITAGAYIWSGFHYEIDLSLLFAGNGFAESLEILTGLLIYNRIGIVLTAVFCALSKILSNQYARMLGKE